MAKFSAEESNIKTSLKLRHFDLIEMLKIQKSLDIDDLVNKLEVSKATIRRDLLELEKKGYLKRIKNGAIHRERLAELGRPFNEREMCYSEEKDAIGRAAAKLVENGDVMYIDGGTTSEFLIRHLSEYKNLTVFTCGLNIAQRLHEMSSCIGILLGGEIHGPSHTVGGVLALEMLEFYKVRFDKAFISATAVSANFGVTNHMLDRIPLKKKVMSVASQSILLTNSSKIGHVSVGQISPISNFQFLVTDKKAQEDKQDDLDAFKDLGVNVILA